MMIYHSTKSGPNCTYLNITYSFSILIVQSWMIWQILFDNFHATKLFENCQNENVIEQTYGNSIQIAEQDCTIICVQFSEEFLQGHTTFVQSCVNWQQNYLLAQKCTKNLEHC